jgi:hypothetical protein
MSTGQQILVFAEDPLVRHTKQLVLQELGFSVISVGTLREVDYVASRTVFDLAILGRSVQPEVKTRAATVVRTKAPATASLEICDHAPTIRKPDYVLRGPSPEELA